MEKNKALSKCMQLCSRKEYCIYDLKQKLENWEITEDVADEIVQELMDQKFIDEERYARAFVNDKFKFNYWGKIKIAYSLRQKQINDTLVKTFINQINSETYLSLAQELIEQKLRKVKAKTTYERNAKVANYMAAKGFESKVVFKILNELK